MYVEFMYCHSVHVVTVVDTGCFAFVFHPQFAFQSEHLLVKCGTDTIVTMLPS